MSVAGVMMGDTQAQRGPKEALAPPQDGWGSGWVSWGPKGRENGPGWRTAHAEAWQDEDTRGRLGHTAQGHGGYPLRGRRWV